MRKLSDEEFDGYMGKGKASAFYLAIIRLKKGEGLFIGKAEWNLGKTPGRICRYIMKKFPQVKYDYGRKPDGSGWAIKRVQ